MALSAARRRALAAYICAVRDAMRLHAWDITVLDEPAKEPNSIIEVAPHGARHHGTMRLGSFFDENRSEQRQSIVHELVHLIQADLFEFFQDGAAHQVLRPAALEWIAERAFAEMEIHADATARLLAPHVPLPPAWPK